MKITDIIADIEKVGSFSLRDDENPNHIKVDWCVERDVMTNNAGRVYFIVVNDVIYKIGGSQDKGGILGTMNWYVGSMSGSPGLNRFGIQLLIKEQLEDGNQVDIYLLLTEKVMAPVKGLFGVEDMLVSTFKEMESKCVLDIKRVDGEFPVWNFQESKTKWRSDICEAYNYNKNRSA